MVHYGLLALQVLHGMQAKSTRGMLPIVKDNLRSDTHTALLRTPADCRFDRRSMMRSRHRRPDGLVWDTEIWYTEKRRRCATPYGSSRQLAAPLMRSIVRSLCRSRHGLWPTCSGPGDIRRNGKQTDARHSLLQRSQMVQQGFRRQLTDEMTEEAHMIQ